MEDSEVVGAIGTVLLTIAGGQVPGKVSVAVRGTRETFIAYADSELTAGSAIVVFNSRGDRQVDVMPAPWVLGE